MVNLIALTFLAVGIGLATFPAQNCYSEEIVLNKWELNKKTLTINPQDPGPCWGLGIPEGSFFELNVSASDKVRIRIGIPVYVEEEAKMILTDLIFNKVGVYFSQKVEVNKSGTYQVEIKNEGTNPVNVSGIIFAKRLMVFHQTVYPYSSLGYPLVFGGVILLIYGILNKPKKRHMQRTRVTKRV